MTMRTRPSNLVLSIWIVAATASMLLPRPAAADEAKIFADIRAFFQTEDADRRAELVREIQGDPAYDRARVGGWLNQAVAFPTLAAGERTIHVALGGGKTRDVVLRIPKGYDAGRAWPLIYALHGTGGRGEDIIGYLEHVLGARVDEFVIAAPTGYGEVVIHDTWPPVEEHPKVLLAVKRAVHVDTGRVLVTGYSRGGHTAWTLAVLHADEFAGVMPLAGTFLLPEVDALWEPFLPNLANTHVFCVWGAQDVAGDDSGAVSPQGGIAGMNRRLATLAESLHLPVVTHEDTEKGHGGIMPPGDVLDEWLKSRRVAYPAKVGQRFRAIYQSHAYWLEGRAWTGPQWTDKAPKVELRRGEDANRPEDVQKAVARAFRSLLGELRGEVKGQVVEVHRIKLKALTIWIGDGLIDWKQPVTVKVSGDKAFEGKLEPDLFVCLAQAARTYDFDRLRWAGLQYRAGAKVQPVTGRTELVDADSP